MNGMDRMARMPDVICDGLLSVTVVVFFIQRGFAWAIFADAAGRDFNPALFAEPPPRSLAVNGSFAQRAAERCCRPGRVRSVSVARRYWGYIRSGPRRTSTTTWGRPPHGE